MPKQSRKPAGDKEHNSSTKSYPNSEHSHLKEQAALAKELKEFSKEVRKLKNLDFLRVFTNPWKFMLFSFLKGLMVGFGSILGASVLVGAFVFLIAQVSFVPFLGDFVEDIIAQIQIDKVKDGTQPDIFDQYEETKNGLGEGSGTTKTPTTQ
ncbi:MAG: DUF5665 domain-containing protein [bacterium]|nr:DUF5665 domain-containing protein [bacterium]